MSKFLKIFSDQNSFFFFFSLLEKNWQNLCPFNRDFNNHLLFIHDRHYSQHQTSVDAARQGMQERLSKLGGQTAFQRQYGGNENYVAGCTTGCSTGSSSAYNSRYRQFFSIQMTFFFLSVDSQNVDFLKSLIVTFPTLY